VWLTRVVRRTGQPERVGGTDLLPLWRATLSGEPDASWRRRFARAAHIDGLFAGRRITFELMGGSSRPIGRLGTVSVVIFERTSEPGGPGGS